MCVEGNVRLLQPLMVTVALSIAERDISTVSGEATAVRLPYCEHDDDSDEDDDSSGGVMMVRLM